MYDEDGNVNNVLEVQEYVPENLASLSSFDPPPSPPERCPRPLTLPHPSPCVSVPHRPPCFGTCTLASATLAGRARTFVAGPLRLSPC
jgi:hypothetical protein